MIYEKIKKLCESKGMSIREVEFLASVSYGSIGHWRDSVPRVDKLKAVATVLDVSLDSLCEEL